MSAVVTVSAVAAVGMFALLAGTGTLIRRQVTIRWGAGGIAMVNLIGSFVAGLLVTRNGPFVTALATGGIGALTTISGLAAQVVVLARSNRWLASGYLVALTFGGIGAAWFGLVLGKT